MKILIVDDEADIREILAFNLKAAGYEVFEAGTAEAALVSIRQGRVPDLFLLDVMLPGMSGFKLADVLRKELKNSTPIISAADCLWNMTNCFLQEINMSYIIKVNDCA